MWVRMYTFYTNLHMQVLTSDFLIYISHTVKMLDRLAVFEYFYCFTCIKLIRLQKKFVFYNLIYQHYLRKKLSNCVSFYIDDQRFANYIEVPFHT